MKAGIATSNSPSFKLVSKYFAAAIISFLTVTLLLLLNYDKLAGHYFQPELLGLVHIAALGWISMIIFGALFQLMPVILEVKLYSEKLAEVQFWLFTLGTAALAYSFWNAKFTYPLSIAASTVVLAVLLFAINAALTIAGVKKLNLTTLYLITAVVWLLITGAAGLLLSINLGFPFIAANHLVLLKAHAHVAFIGWVSMIIMGVAYKLIPMFSLSHGYSMLPAKIVLPLINLGLIGITVEMIYENYSLLYYASAAAIAAAILLFLLQMIIIIRKRIRKVLDLGLSYSMVSFLFLFIVTVIGISLIWIDDIVLQTNISLLYGFLIIFAYISLLIKAQMYKILPFLVWFNKHSRYVGIKPVPLLKDMFNEHHAIWGFSFFITGIIISAAGLVYGISVILLLGLSLVFISALVFTWNMIVIFRR